MSWLLFGANVVLPALVLYLIVAVIAGCPYCMYPDLAWPVTLCRDVWRQA